MKLLLTSGGITNASIENALIALLGKPIAECSALLIPTAIYAHPMAGPFTAWQAISGQFPGSYPRLGWKQLGLLELTALTTLTEELWLPKLQSVDALLVEGGDALYLSYWMQKSGVAALLPSLSAIYVGLSAGSMVMTPKIGEYFANWTPPDGVDQTLGMVDFSIFPHLDHPQFVPHNSMADAEKWAATIGVPSYAIDDETAIQVVDGKVEVISEGNWKQFTR